ncbi:hypothetical protein QFZ22_000081 [Streptomyces canus]|uniref:Uncharacterized protein n=1 Tax=Streptomyces canus TaxID=58343 RepID=A0AAW8F227_9ACTN|nr:hypothetical protein [Streptomyces canus]MDQ0904096.1 hypothetical protein [Streptomyces canus]
MDKARLFQNGRIGSKVFAHEIDDEPWWRRQKVTLICPFCMTAVVSQRTSVGRHPRGALFRLAADQQHEHECPLNPTEVLEKIAHGSQGVAVIDGGELHLVLPDDLDQIGTTVPTLDPDAAVGATVGVNISTVHPLLPPLINSAVVIARFLQKHGYDPDVVGQFKVRRPGEKTAVGWGEFCYGPTTDDHGRLYARLTSGARPAHPVAVYGRVMAVEKDRQERPVLRLSDGNGYTVRIRSDHPSLLAPLTAGAFVLAVGFWKPWAPRPGARTELQMFAEEHWQLAYWTYDASTGHSSPPRCPSPLSLAQRTLRQARQARSATTGRPPAPPQPAPAQTPPPDPAVPDPASPEPPALPPLPPQPPAPPQPAAPPPGRSRRRWWPFGRR